MGTVLMQADGHCLYRAVGDQLGSHTNGAAEANDLWAIRAKAAAYMRAHPDQFVPFMTEASSPFALFHLTVIRQGYRSCPCCLPTRAIFLSGEPVPLVSRCRRTVHLRSPGMLWSCTLVLQWI